MIDEECAAAEKDYPEMARAREDLLRRYQDIPPPTAEFSAALTGWVELFHRTTRRPQLAYIVVASTGNSSDGK